METGAVQNTFAGSPSPCSTDAPLPPPPQHYAAQQRHSLSFSPSLAAMFKPPSKEPALHGRLENTRGERVCSRTVQHGGEGKEKEKTL